MNKKGKWISRVVATLMIMVVTVGTSDVKLQAKESTNRETSNLETTIVSEPISYDADVQPLTIMTDCEIVLAFTGNGLEMTFSTSSIRMSSVIGVKDIKVQQKMWYGWKTVFTSDGAENYNQDVFMGGVTYPDAVNGKTYRVTCVHYANYDVYEEVENDTGAFKFIY